MSVQTLYTAATGMSSMETKLNVIANNLANIETTGFKRDRVNFEDLFYDNQHMPGTEDRSGQRAPVGIQIGLGTNIVATQSDFSQGGFKQTGNQLDIVIEGRGFFQVMDPSGDIYYTRAGNFIRNRDGNLALASSNIGRLIEPPITIPPDATDISVSAEGIVAVRQPGSQEMTQVGTIELASFVNPEGLLKLGDNLYAQSDASGTPTLSSPGQDGVGLLRQGVLEASNVEPVTELIDLITTQRAFEMNSQVIKTADDLLQTVANLRRY